MYPITYVILSKSTHAFFGWFSFYVFSINFKKIFIFKLFLIFYICVEVCTLEGRNLQRLALLDSFETRLVSGWLRASRHAHWELDLGPLQEWCIIKSRKEV